MVDRAWIGLQTGPVIVTAEAGQMRLFAKATGQTDLIYFDEGAARAAGYRAIVAAPTFVYALHAIGQRDPFELYERIGVRLADTLHGAQSFTYGDLVFAGDVIRYEGAISDIYEKKAGALTFVVVDTIATNQFGHEVARMQTTIIVVKR